MIETHCTCGRHIRANHRLMGKRVRCPTCEGVFRVGEKPANTLSKRGGRRPLRHREPGPKHFHAWWHPVPLPALPRRQFPRRETCTNYAIATLAICLLGAAVACFFVSASL